MKLGVTITYLAYQRARGACGWRGMCCSALPLTCWTMENLRGIQWIAAPHFEALAVSGMHQRGMVGRWMLEGPKGSTHCPACI